MARARDTTHSRGRIAHVVVGLALGCALLTSTGCRPSHTKHAGAAPLQLPYPGGRATYYTTVAAAHRPGRGADVCAALTATAARRGHALATDGRLAALARWAHEHALGDGLPPQAAVDAAAHHLGLPEPTPVLVVYRLAAGTDFIAHVRNDLDGAVLEHGSTHVGAYVADGSASVTVVVVLSARKLQLQPLPRELATPGGVALSGRLADGFTGPELIVQDPDGRLERSALGDGRAFDVRVPLPTTGVHRLELLAQGPGGVTVAANVPLWVAVHEPASIELRAPERDRPGTDVGAALLRAINATRAQQQLPPLARRPDLDRVALAHSRDMRDHGFVAHQSPTTGSVSDRLRAAGVDAPLMAENIGRSYSSAELHAGLMASPGHRGNILHPRATHVGIGVVRVPEGDGSDALLATEVFIEEPAPLDPRQATEAGLAGLARVRRAAKVGPLTRDPTLMGLAETAARRFVAQDSPPQEAVVQQVHAGLQQEPPPYARFQTLIVVGDRIDLAELEPLRDPTAAAIGVGFAQGQRRDRPATSVTAAVIVLGYR